MHHIIIMSLTIKYITCCCGSLPTIGNNRQNPNRGAKVPSKHLQNPSGPRPHTTGKKISSMLSKSTSQLITEFEIHSICIITHLQNWRALDRTTSQQSKTKRKFTWLYIYTHINSVKKKVIYIICFSSAASNLGVFLW